MRVIRSSAVSVLCASVLSAFLAACGGGGGGAAFSHDLTIVKAGSGTGSVSGSPGMVNCGSTCMATFDQGTDVTLTATPANGSTFTGWSGACSGGTTQMAVKIDAAKTCIATFALLRTVSVSKSGAGSGSVTSNPVGIDCGATCRAEFAEGTSVVLTSTPTVGSVFVQWGGDCAGATATASVVLSQPRACTAQFEPVFTLSVAKSGTGGGVVASAPAGIDCGASCNGTFAAGAQVTLTATAGTGSVFSGWSGGTAAANACSGNGACATAALNQDSSVTATFTLNPAQIQVAATASTTPTNGGGGVVLCSADGGMATTCGAYPAGTALTLTAVPNGASNFVGWSGTSGSASACSGTTIPCSFTLNLATAVTAIFDRPVVTVTVTGAGGTVTSSPVGFSCSSGNTCQQPFDKGTNLTLSASGAGFSGWTGGGCAGTGTCVALLGANAAITANFGGAGLPSFALAALEAYVKATNTGASDNFGYRVALSGETLAVGAPFEASGATGVNGDQTNNSANDSGAVYVFTRVGGVWSQQAYVKASNTDAFDRFGFSVDLSGDTLAVGAPFEASATTGINGDQTNNSAINSGAVYIFTRTGGVWSQQAYVKGSNTRGSDLFGSSVALAGDTLAVGAIEEDGAATGVNGDQTNLLAPASGAVYVFARTGVNWTQVAYVKASNTGTNDLFGSSLALAGDTLAIGATRESSAATGVNGDQSNNGANRSGAVYVFARTGGVWSQQAYLKASNTGAADEFGSSLALSGDTLAIGASEEDSATIGVNGEQTNNGSASSGAVYVFTRTGGVWSQQAYVKASNTGVGDQFGYSVALSDDTLAVGAQSERSSATGINGDQANNNAIGSGAVYVLTRIGGVWSQQAYVKASNTEASDRFGASVALTGDSLVVGAIFESSAATGINGDQTSNGVGTSGAAYVYRAR